MDISYVDDLLPFAAGLSEAQANLLIVGGIGRAVAIAPCIAADGFAHEAAAKDIVITAILRRAESVSGGKTTITRGPFSESHEAPQVMFWPAEIAELQALCASAAGTVAGSPVYSFPDPVPWPC